MQQTSYLPIICQNHPSLLQMMFSGEEEAQNELLIFWVELLFKLKMDLDF